MENSKVIYDKATNQAFEVYGLGLDRTTKRDFISKGTVKKTFTEKGTVGILINSKKKIISTVLASMKIGDFYEGKRVNDLKFLKFKIEKDTAVGFIYTLD